MNIFATLGQKPWLENGEPLPPAIAAAEVAVHARRSALRVFLVVVSILFTLMLIAYAGRMSYQDWRPAPQIRLLWGNTAVLFIGSALLQWALVCARRGRRDAVRMGLLGAGTFTVVFLFGQMLAWRQLAAMVLGDYSNPAVGFFYMISGVHGLHMVGGLFVLLRTTLRAWGDTSPRRLVGSIGNCALYWHFLLGVWLVMFGLLFSGNNFELLLELCGIR